MPTKNPRINITLGVSTASLLAKLAEQEHTSISNIAKELVLEALERREDKILSRIAKARDTVKAKKTDHDDAWK
ncbi:MAG: hypothetical protein ACD_60C00126G0019 [uncultured bacterium]|nr:MAG: hypothetical protein ACD_60C00126G0019 [uncultured bacterium]